MSAILSQIFLGRSSGFSVSSIDGIPYHKVRNYTINVSLTGRTVTRSISSGFQIDVRFQTFQNRYNVMKMGILISNRTSLKYE